MRRVLIVAYYFPPVGGIGSLRLAAFASHLPEFGWEPTIIAPVGTPHASDDSISFAEHKVVRARSLEPAILLQRLDRPSNGVKRDGAVSDLRPAVGSGSRRFARLRAELVRLAFPDPQIGWYPAAVGAGMRLINERAFDAVFSSAYPITAHLVAGSISRRGGLPWVAEFRDPWSERVAGFPYRTLAERLERRITHRASRVVVPSTAFAEHYAAVWGVEVAAIPNGHELPPVTQAEADSSTDRRGPPTVAHVGSYYPGSQSLRTVWRALAQRRRSGQVMPRIRWVGDLTAEARAEAASYGLLEFFEVTGRVSHTRALQLLYESTILIASGQLDTGPLGRGTTAAKLFEYLASGLPILYVSSPDADAAAMLAEYDGCYTVAFDDDLGAQRALEAGLAGGRYPRDVTSFSRTARTAELANVLAEAVSAGGGRRMESTRE